MITARSLVQLLARWTIGVILASTVSFNAFALTLEWIDNSIDEDGFIIERAESGGAFTRIDVVGANVTTYVDTSIIPSVSYLYRVYAFNPGGNSAYTNIVGNAPAIIAQPASTITATVGDSVTLTVNATGAPAVAYRWRKNGVELADAGRISGSQTATLRLALVTTSDAGNYSVRIFNGIPNEVISNDAVLTVNKATPSITAAPTASAITFGQTLATSTLSGGGASVPGTFAFTSPPTALNAGPGQTVNVTFTPTDTANYNSAIRSTTLTVNKAPLSVIANAASRIYGAAGPTFTAIIAGFVNGENLGTSGVTGVPSITTNATATSAVGGSYAITPALGTLAAPNYSFTFGTGMLTITKAPLTVTADTKSMVYGSPNPPFTATISGFVNGETLATSGVAGAAALSTTATATTGVGNVAITPAVGSLTAANYSFATFNPGTLTITPAPLTVAADAKSKTFGAANPPFTATLTGFINGENLATSGVTGSAALTTDATVTSPIGTYAIIAARGTLVAANYQFARFLDSTLTVVEALISPVITIQPVSQTVLIGANVTLTVIADGSPSPTYQWRKNGSAISGATGSALTLSNVQLGDEGSYDVVATSPVGSVTSNPAILAVNQTSYAGTYFGTFPDGGSWALYVRADNTATFLAFLPDRSTAIVIDLLVNPDGTLSASGMAISSSNSATPLFAGVPAQNGSVSEPVEGGPLPTLSLPAVSPSNGPSPSPFSPSPFSLTSPPSSDVSLPPSPSLRRASSSSLPSLPLSLSSSEVSLSPSLPLSLSSASSDVSLSSASSPPASAAAPVVFTLTGRIVNGQFTGLILDKPLSATVDQGSGQSTGFYKAGALLAATGTTYSIVGPSGKAVVVTTTPTAVDGAAGTFSTTGQLSVATASGAQLAVTLDSASKSISASYAAAGSTTPVTFSGVQDTVQVTSALTNLSIRSTAGASDQTLIVGFAVTGGSKPMLVRGIGPALAGFGVTGSLPDPKLDLFRAGVSAAIGSNDNWTASTADVFARVGAFSLPTGSRDAALTATLEAGTYTVQLADGSGATGIALLELYDTAAGVSARLVNVSARSQVGTGGGILIAGFNVSGTGSRKLLIRAIGPALTAFGVAGALADPRLELFASGSTVAVAANDNWDAGAASAFSQVGAFNLTVGSKDAVLLLTLTPGTYTAQVSGVGNTTGVALVEIYELP